MNMFTHFKNFVATFPRYIRHPWLLILMKVFVHIMNFLHFIFKNMLLEHPWRSSIFLRLFDVTSEIFQKYLYGRTEYSLLISIMIHVQP